MSSHGRQRTLLCARVSLPSTVRRPAVQDSQTVIEESKANGAVQARPRVHGPDGQDRMRTAIEAARAL